MNANIICAYSVTSHGLLFPASSHDTSPALKFALQTLSAYNLRLALL